MREGVYFFFSFVVYVLSAEWEEFSVVGGQSAQEWERVSILFVVVLCFVCRGSGVFCCWGAEWGGDERVVCFILLKELCSVG